MTACENWERTEIINGQLSIINRRVGGVLLVVWGSLLLLAGCAFPGSTRPVIKIGLIAPFEGLHRAGGYRRLYGVKLALREANRAGGVAGYSIELVALNDFADPAETAAQARELALDPDVRGVIGNWEPAPAEAARPVYEAAQLAVVDPTQFTDFSALPPSFPADYQSLAGSPPDAQAQQAYLATRRLLEAIESAVRQTGRPDRASVRRALRRELSLRYQR